MTPALAFRGSLLHLLRDPGDAAASDAVQHFQEGVLVVRDGRIVEAGSARDVLARLPADAAVKDYSGKLLVPGFVDCRIHYPQTDMIASHGAQLLEWRLRQARDLAEKLFAWIMLGDDRSVVATYASGEEVYPACGNSIFACAEGSD